MPEPAHNNIETVTMARGWPVPVLGCEPPTEEPGLDTDWMKRGTATSSTACTFTGMKEGELWKFEFFDAVAPEDNEVPPQNVAYRPYDGQNEAVATDALHRTTQPLEYRIRHGQSGYSFIALGSDVIVSAVRLV